MIKVEKKENGIIVNESELVGLVNNMGEKYFFYPIPNSFNLRCAIYKHTLGELKEEIANRIVNPIIEDKMIADSMEVA